MLLLTFLLLLLVALAVFFAVKLYKLLHRLKEDYDDGDVVGGAFLLGQLGQLLTDQV